MNSTVLYIKNMVCNRCIKVVKEELLNLGFKVTYIELGKVELNRKIDDSDLIKIKHILFTNGFELIDDKRSSIIERMKKTIIEYVHHGKEIPKQINLSDILSNEIGHDYSYLSSLFSSIEGKTIEKYVIQSMAEIDRIAPGIFSLSVFSFTIVVLYNSFQSHIMIT